MRGSTNRRARIAKSLDKRVERLEGGRTEVHKRERKSSFKLPVPARSGEVPLRVSNLCVRYDANTVLADVDFHCRRGDRVVVIGRNGAGKSSLLRCLAGVQEPTAGTVEPGANVALGYFAQEHEQVDLSVSVLDNIDDRILTKETERRALLGSFGLVGECRLPDAQDPVGRRAGQARTGHAGRRTGQRPPPRRADQQPGPHLDRGGRAPCCPTGPAPSSW